jgi:hypothetical protein
MCKNDQMLFDGNLTNYEAAIEDEGDEVALARALALHGPLAYGCLDGDLKSFLGE